MPSPVTYPSNKIGSITHATPEERTREGDRWVALRTIRTAPAQRTSSPVLTEDPPAVQTRALYHAINQRHADARRKLEN